MQTCRNVLSRMLVTFALMVFGLSTAGAESGIKNRQIFVGTSARALGMGGAFTAGPASSASSFWNPSSLGLLEATEFSLVGLPFPASADDREGAFSLALNPQQLGIVSRNVGNFSISSWFDGWGNDAEKNRLVLVGYGASLGKGIAAGTNLRHYRHRSPVSPRHAWSFDLGIRFVRGLESYGEKVAVGLALEDLAGHIWENGQTVARIPGVTRLGAAHFFNRDTTLSGDFVLHNDTRIEFVERLRAHFGVERWLFKNGLGLRFGYTAAPNRFTQGEWSTGLSVRSPSGQLDYAYVTGNELNGAMHWTSATLRWGAGNAAASVSRSPIVEVSSPAPSPPDPIVMPQPIRAVMRISEDAISPNGDGVKDETTIELDINEDSEWVLEIQKMANQGAPGQIFQHYTGTGLPSTEIVWEGEDDAGNRVNDGTYIARWFIIDRAGNRRLEKESTIIVDSTPASVEISAEPPIFESGGVAGSDGQSVLRMPKVHLQVSDRHPLARWELQFFDADQEQVYYIDEEGEPSDTVVWNSWKQADSNEPSTYRCVLTVHDIAGNRSTGEASFSTFKIDRKDSDDSQTEVVIAPIEEELELVDVPIVSPRYTLLVGSFQNKSNAESLVDSLEVLKLGAGPRMSEVTIRSRLWYRVTIGGFHNKEDATGLIDQVVALGIEPLLITNMH